LVRFFKEKLLLAATLMTSDNFHPTKSSGITTSIR
jgi:hypothetical protein